MLNSALSYSYTLSKKLLLNREIFMKTWKHTKQKSPSYIQNIFFVDWRFRFSLIEHSGNFNTAYAYSLKANTYRYNAMRKMKSIIGLIAIARGCNPEKYAQLS